MFGTRLRPCKSGRTTSQPSYVASFKPGALPTLARTFGAGHAAPMISILRSMWLLSTASWPSGLSRHGSLVLTRTLLSFRIPGSMPGGPCSSRPRCYPGNPTSRSILCAGSAASAPKPRPQRRLIDSRYAHRGQSNITARARTRTHSCCSVSVSAMGNFYVWDQAEPEVLD